MSDKTPNKPAQVPSDNKPKVVKEAGVVTINMQPLLTPISIILSAIIISSGFLVGLNNIATTLKGGVSTTTTTGSTTNTTNTTNTTATGTTAAVSLDQIKSIFTSGTNITFGDATRKVLFVEFSDPSCPYCHIAGGLDEPLEKSAGSQFETAADGGTYVPPLPEIRKLVDSGQASFAEVYLNGHGNGQLGQEALYCANEQGKFWAVHDLLMSDDGYNMLNTTVQNDKTKTSTLADYLKSAIDPTFLTSCITSGKYDTKLTTDISLAGTFGVSGTPGFFVNTTAYNGAYSWSDMQATVNSALGQS